MKAPTCTIGRGFSKEVKSLTIPKATIPKLSLAIHQGELVLTMVY